MPIAIADLMVGDILLKLNDGSNVNNIISAGQKLTKAEEYKDITHAAIYHGNNIIVESIGDGVVRGDLRQAPRRDNVYLVFRCLNQPLREDAAARANDLWNAHRQHKNIKYGKAIAGRSVLKVPKKAPAAADIDAKGDSLMAGEKHTIFCSSFVTFVYQWAAVQRNLPVVNFFPFDDNSVAPSTLAALLERNQGYFEFVGVLG